MARGLRSLVGALRRRGAGPAHGRAERVLARLNQALSTVDVALVRSSSSRAGVGAPPHLAAARVDRAVTPDLNQFLHELRTERLGRMPAGAHVLLSAGCSGAWYFDWLDTNYPGVTRHIGLEAFLPRPADLPPHVTWIAESVGSMTGVETESVDLVFSGQNIEHLWPEDVEGFLLESHRVLRPGGWIVLDSPNRSVTEALNYVQPEHITEMTPAEIAELLELAGFSEISVKGVWLCFDRDQQLLLPLGPQRVLRGWTAARRASEAADRPEDSFIWWAEARKGDRPVRGDDLRAAVNRNHDAAFGHRTEGFVSEVGRVAGRGRQRTVSVDQGEVGVLVRGPNAPVRAGRHVARFALRCSPTVAPSDVVAHLEVASMGGTHAREAVLASQVSGPDLSAVDVAFALDSTAMGVEYRVVSTGSAALTARAFVDVDPGP